MEATPTALVTGGSRGIGRAISLVLAKLGYAVGVNYVSNRAAADEVVAEIKAAAGRAWPVPGDVGNAQQRQAMLDELLQHAGRLDVLVNNAGITSPGRLDLLDLTEESWDQVFGVNLKGPFFLSQLAARQMISQGHGGKIINLSSISAYAVSTNRVDYCIAKAAMQMMTWQLATRLAEHQIGVFEICPGVISSDMTAPVQEKYDQLIADGLSPIRRWGQPQDIALAVSAIVSNYFPFTTGQQFHIDGGFHIRRL